MGNTTEICLSHQSAALLWRAVREGRLERPVITELRNIPDNLATSRSSLRQMDLSPLGIQWSDQGMNPRFRSVLVTDGASERRLSIPLGLSGPIDSPLPLHVLTGSRRQRDCHPSICTHLLSTQLPTGSIYRFDQHILVTAPELTFLQVCSRARSLPNIELALEWCGTYALGSGEEHSIFDIEPLTSAEKLRSYLSQLGRFRGAPAARQALAWVVDGLASPRESEVFLLIVLPLDQGGYGFAVPLVNAVIPLRGTHAESMTSHNHFKVDLLWTERRVIMEYDGLEEHEKIDTQIAADKERRSVLAALGYHVIVITKRDLKSTRDLEKKCAQLAVALGVPLPQRDEQQATTHKALLRWLANPRHDHLPFGCLYH